MRSSATFPATILCLLILTMALPGSSVAASPAVNPLSHEMGVFPFLPPRELEKIFAPFAASIGHALGKEMHFQSTRTYRDFMARTDEQQYSVIFVQPFDYIRLADKKLYEPLATRKENLSAIIVSKSDSNINSIADLKGKTIAMPPKVAAVSRLSKNMLVQKGLTPNKAVSITHHRSHASCLQQVLIGSAAACATAAPAVRFVENKMKVKFKIVDQTREIPHTLFAVSTKLGEREKKIIRDTILSWAKTAEGKKLLERGRMKPFKIIEDKAYNIVRQINKNNPL